jgi:orotate phosphoribosyltransferase
MIQNTSNGTRDGSHLIDSGGDFLRTLENCEGYYVCPTDSDGKLKGPVVGYTAPYDLPDGTKKKWVGLTYYNFAKADPWPAVLTFFAVQMHVQLKTRGMQPNVIVGAPWAGVKFSQEVARLQGCRHIFAEKQGDDLILGRYENEIRPGDDVMIGEELVNNASTTGKLIKLIESAGGRVMGIFCAINRSSPFKETFWMAPESDPIPIIGVINRETPQYKQHDPVVAGDIASGNVVWKPKYAWEQMRVATDAAKAA